MRASVYSVSIVVMVTATPAREGRELRDTMNRTIITADTITDSQIRALRSEASDAWDNEQVAICDIALGDGAAATETWTRKTARAECARVINEAAAQVEG